jgi:zinc metalloprotease ZmpB
MAFTLTPEVKVRRDAQGNVRQLSHTQEPYRPDAMAMAIMAADGKPATLTPRALAEEYLRDVAGFYGFAPAALANFAAAPAAAAITTVPTELRFKEEKAVANAATVSYDQTHFGLPIWNAGVAVRINTAQMAVISSHNATHYTIACDDPDPNAPYMPNRLTPPVLKGLLGLGTSDEEPRVHATRLLIYQYLPDQRFDDQIDEHRSPTAQTGLAGAAAREFPTLPLPPLPPSIQPERHYVVSEAMFELARTGWGMLNWRAFIEPRTGAVSGCLRPRLGIRHRPGQRYGGASHRCRAGRSGRHP